MPDYQNEYGGGFDQSYGVYYSNWGPSFRKEGLTVGEMIQLELLMKMVLYHIRMEMIQ